MRRKKKSMHLSIIQPMLASVLLATSIPLVTLAAVRTDADAVDGLVFKNFEPREDQSVLFDLVEFRKAHRIRHDKSGSSDTASSEDTSSSVASSVSPCADQSETSAQSSTSSSAPTMLRYDDLSSTEQAELWKQLRIGGCPYDVLPGYRELCELMLEQRRLWHPASEIPKALRNPGQQ